MRSGKYLMTALLCACAAAAIAACGQQDEGEHIHDYGEWVVYSEATCEEGGYKSRVCAECGASETEKLPALGHNYEERVITPATCSEGGESEFVCKREPSHRYLGKTQALGHDWKEEGEGYRAPTCTQWGYSASAVCRRCETRRENEEIPPLGHDYSGEAVIEEATCEKAGSKKTACARGCGSVKTEDIAPLEHSFGEEKTVKEPTCTADGEKQSACTRCGKTVKTTIPAPGHEWDEQGEVVPATCLEEGYSASAVCRLCGQTRGKTILPALGHDYSGTVFYDYMPTCMDEGRAHTYCTRCVTRQSIVLPKAQHEFTAIEYVVRPTCTTDGTMRYVCRYHCGKKQEPETAPALGHDWKELKRLQEPTCTDAGLQTHQCLRCKETEDDILMPLGHLYEDYEVKTPATSSAEGVKVLRCVRCNREGETGSIPRITSNVEYEVRLRRVSGLDYQYPKEVRFRVYQGDRELSSFNAEGAVTKITLPKEADRLTVEGLRGGFTTDRKEYPLTPGGPFVTVKLTAGVRQESRAEIPHKEIKPESDLIDLGEPVYDFLVRDCYNRDDYSEDRWFSDVLKGKKLVMFDFFWTGCTSCTALMEQFLQAYDKKLQPYKDQIQVIMVDVMNDEDRDDVRRFKENKYYPQEFIACVGNEISGFNFFRWFDLDKNNLHAPPNIVFTDSEGVVIKINGIGNSSQFEEFILDYFKNYRDPANAQKTSAAASYGERTEALPALFDPAKRKSFSEAARRTK